ncbi:hypothetical protein HJG60_008188 [Phyllostomus discolor]|uniref:Uncharacterized protein n=1 Tax=Phyllostomus discolor TaxID=89673 RepID=A0A834DP86_9CHIR|nr:hypothetical protein HJG60_008188 [Phyllostomus discolor]
MQTLSTTELEGISCGCLLVVPDSFVPAAECLGFRFPPSCAERKLYKKACLKSQKYAHRQTRVLTHIRQDQRNLISYIVGKARGKSWQEKIRSDQLKMLECYSNGMKWFLVHTKREGGQAGNDKSRIPERKSHWSCRS